MPASTHHVTRVGRPNTEGRTDAYGHSTCHCDTFGCSGVERYLGTYDREDVTFDGECFVATTDTGNDLLLRDDLN